MVLVYHVKYLTSIGCKLRAYPESQQALLGVAMLGYMCSDVAGSRWLVRGCGSGCRVGKGSAQRCQGRVAPTDTPGRGPREGSFCLRTAGSSRFIEVHRNVARFIEMYHAVAGRGGERRIPRARAISGQVRQGPARSGGVWWSGERSVQPRRDSSRFSKM